MSTVAHWRSFIHSVGLPKTQAWNELLFLFPIVSLFVCMGVICFAAQKNRTKKKSPRTDTCISTSYCSTVSTLRLAREIATLKNEFKRRERLRVVTMSMATGMGGVAVFENKLV